jgi:CubicO group peptidase (beta-lactamase class C family)
MSETKWCTRPGMNRPEESILALPSEGLTSAGIERVHATAEQHVGDERVPGLVAVVARGEHVHVEVLGNLTIGGAPVARDSLFRLSSTTKPITAAATLALIDEGVIGLDEPVERLLPELRDRRVLRRMDGPLDDTVPAARAITTRDLLTFTFGFGMALEMFSSISPWPIMVAEQQLKLATLGPPDPEVQPDPDTWIANLGTLLRQLVVGRPRAAADRDCADAAHV